MTDKDLLLSISNLMDKKLQPIQNQLVAVEERLNTKVERLQGEFKSLQGEFKSLQGEFKSLQGEMKSLQGGVHQIKVHLECNIEPRLQNIENCYLSTFERYKDSTEKIESMEMDVSVMKDVILEHSRQLKMIS